MKKIVSTLMTLVLILVLLASCGGGETPRTTGSESDVNKATDIQDETEKITIAEPETNWTPTKEIRCIVPFAPGGGSDILTRLIMDHIELPSSMVAVNIDGGAGLVGAQQASQEKADGYTILAHNPMNLIAQGLTGTNKLWEELSLLAFVVDDWEVVCTNKESGWKNIDDFIEAAKADPGAIKWGVTGSGITMADSIRAMRALDIDANLVPYDGGAETRAALLGNHIQIELTTSSDVRSYIESGDVIPLFVIANDRCPFIDVPTLLELGHEVTSGAPRAYFGPPEMETEIVNYYSDKFEELSNNTEFVEASEDLGFVVNFVGAEEGSRRMKEWYDANLPIFEELELGS